VDPVRVLIALMAGVFTILLWTIQGYRRDKTEQKRSGLLGWGLATLLVGGLILGLFYLVLWSLFDRL
jgi:hypothetical protein